MSVVLLVRHGQASFGLGTYDRLSDHGQLQAQRVGEILRERGVAVDRVLSGSLERQRDTAEAIATAVGSPDRVQIDPRWNEYEHMPLITRVKPAYRKRWLMAADLARSGDPSGRLQDVLDTALAQWVAESGAAASPDAEAYTAPETFADAGTGTPPELLDGSETDASTETFTAYSSRIAAALDDVSGESGTSVVVSSAGTITAAIAPLVGVPPSAWPAMQRVMVNASITKVVRGRRGVSLISYNEHGHLEGRPDVQITYR